MASTSFFKAIEEMCEHDRSAAPGEMAMRGLYVFSTALNSETHQPTPCPSA